MTHSDRLSRGHIVKNLPLFPECKILRINEPTKAAVLPSTSKCTTVAAANIRLL